MGNIWGRRSSSQASEPEEDGPTGSIEMKGSNLVEPAECSSSSLSSWPICFQQRPATRSVRPRSCSSEKQATNQVRDLTSSSPASSSRATGADAEIICCIDSDQASGACSSTEQEYHEVKLTLKIPRHSGNELAGDGTHEDLTHMERQWQAATRALSSKTEECEGLVNVVRELTESRNKLMSLKSIQGERFTDLQHDFLRVMRVADLSRALSRENVAKSAHLSQCLNQAEEELAKQRLANQQVADRCLRLKLENADLKQKLGLIERLDLLTFRRESACLVEFQQLHLKETY